MSENQQENQSPGTADAEGGTDTQTEYPEQVTEVEAKDMTPDKDAADNTTKPEGEGLTDTNAGPDAAQGTVADQPDEPSQAGE